MAMPWCCSTCTFFTDDFARDDDTDLGAKWNEAAGAAAIVSGAMEVTAGGDRIIAVATHPTGSISFQLSVDVKISDINDNVMVIFNWTDANNFMWVGMSRLSGTTRQIGIFQRKGGAVNSLTPSQPQYTGVTGAFFNLKICVDEQERCVVIFDETTTLVRYLGFDGYLPLGANSFGVGQFSGGTVTFDNFTLSQHKDTKSSCPVCEAPAVCSRCSPGIPETWVVDLGLGGWANDDCDGCVNILGEYTARYVSSCTWQYIETGICPDTVIRNAPDPECDLALPGDPVNEATLIITVTVESGVFRVRVLLIVCAANDDCLDPGSGGFCEARSEAEYTLTKESTVDCINEFTLTKISESHTQTTPRATAGASPLCSGTLPGTLTIEGFNLL